MPCSLGNIGGIQRLIKRWSLPFVSVPNASRSLPSQRRIAIVPQIMRLANISVALSAVKTLKQWFFNEIWIGTSNLPVWQFVHM